MSEQKIIEFLTNNGPSNPAQVGKFLGVQLLFASAMLSEAASKGNVKITKMKIGSSPLYYLDKNKDMLINFKDKLNSKDRIALELLEKKGVIRDSSVEPITRVSLREIKDFAIPLNIVKGNKNEVFWKWYLLSDQEATEKIKIIFESENTFNSKNIETKEKTENQNKTKQNIENTENKKISDEKIQTKSEEKSKEIDKNLEQNNISTPTKENISNINKKTKKEQDENAIKEKQTMLEDESKKEYIENTNNTSDLKISNEEFISNCNSSFANKIYNYFKEKNFNILYYELENKKTKFSFIVNVPNAVSSTKYYAKAIDKKTINDGDLAICLVEANYKNLPALFFTTGNISKKIKEKIDSLFKDITLINI